MERSRSSFSGMAHEEDSSLKVNKTWLNVKISIVKSRKGRLSSCPPAIRCSGPIHKEWLTSHKTTNDWLWFCLSFVKGVTCFCEFYLRVGHLGGASKRLPYLKWTYLALRGAAALIFGNWFSDPGGEARVSMSRAPVMEAARRQTIFGFISL